MLLDHGVDVDSLDNAGMMHVVLGRDGTVAVAR